jgi:hypothetical protein
MRGSSLLNYDSVCLIAACFFYYNDDKLLSLALFVLSIIVWVSCFGAQFQESDKKLNDDTHDRTFD